jgi:hypothetical protein
MVGRSTVGAAAIEIDHSLIEKVSGRVAYANLLGRCVFTLRSRQQIFEGRKLGHQLSYRLRGSVDERLPMALMGSDPAAAE